MTFWIQPLLTYKALYPAVTDTYRTDTLFQNCPQQDANESSEDSNKLGLENVGGVFVVLIAGTLAAFVMAILELLWNCRKIAVAEKVRCAA
jgi:hypothetical protein